MRSRVSLRLLALVSLVLITSLALAACAPTGDEATPIEIPGEDVEGEEATPIEIPDDGVTEESEEEEEEEVQEATPIEIPDDEVTDE